MAGETFVKIATVDVGAGGAGTITFSAIPNTFTDLRVYISGRNTAPNASFQMTFNGSSASLNNRQIWTDTFNIGTDSYSGGPSPYMNGSGFAANTFGVTEIYIPNYASSSFYKTSHINGVNEENASYGGLSIIGTLLSNNAAITSLTFTPDGGGSFAQYSSATLYGILKGTGGATVTTA